MRDLVQKLPSGNTHDSGTSDETIAAVLATLNEVIKKSAEFSRSLLDVGGVERLVNMTRHRGRYSVRVVKFASQVREREERECKERERELLLLVYKINLLETQLFKEPFITQYKGEYIYMYIC